MRVLLYTVSTISSSFKNIIRHVSTVNPFRGTKDIHKNSIEHVYQKNFSKSELIDHVVNNIIYKNDNYIVTSKPYGIGKEETKTYLKDKEYLPQTFEDVYFNDVLPEVAKTLNCKTIKVVKAPERFASGVTILAITDYGENLIKKSLERAKRLQQSYSTYLVVTVGCPSIDSDEKQFGLNIFQKYNHTVPVLLEEWSKNKVKKNEIKVVSWKHKTVMKSKFASLVKVNLSYTHKNSLKLILATKYTSPVLGDKIYGNSVKNAFGVSLPANLDLKVLPQALNSDLLSALEIEENEQAIIPSHVHLESITLPITKKKTITFTLRPPTTFLWTCQKMNLPYECKDSFKES